MGKEVDEINKEREWEKGTEDRWMKQGSKRQRNAGDVETTDG